MRHPIRRPANQTAIARAAGVSVSTVSRALSNAPGISEARRAQIRQLAQESGYFGRSQGGGGTRALLTYVTSSMATGGLAPFYDAILKALTDSAKEAGLTLAVRLVDQASLDLKRVLRDTAAEPVVAVLLVGIDATEEIAVHCLNGPLKLLLVNGYDPQMRLDCVAPNNFFGGMMAAQRLLDAGHRSLLYVEDHIRWTTLQRRRGFLAAIEGTPGAHGSTIGIARDPDQVLAQEIERRRQGATDWTGAFCVNDMSAIRLIGALEAAGVSVPAEASVIGFDDLPYAAMMKPPLSTLAVDNVMIGRQAIALLLRRLAEPSAPAMQVECGVRMEVGGTVAQLTQNRDPD